MLFGWVKTTGLILTLTASSLLVQEFAVRLALPDYDPTRHLRFNAPNKDLPSLGSPGSEFRQIKNSGDYNIRVKFNRYGLRDSDDIATAGADDFLMVGDSFAFGWGVEENERLGEQLEKMSGHRVFNLASPGDLDGYERLIAYARKLGARSRNIIIAVNMTDDVKEYQATLPAYVEGPEASEPFRLAMVKESLLQNSALYFLATSTISRSDWLRAQLVNSGLIAPLSQVSAQQVDERAIASTVQSLRGLAAQYSITVLVIPHRALWIENGRSEEQRRHTLFINALKAAKLSFVDMKQEQERGGGDPMRFHFANDGHWRPIGHKLAAEALFAHMKVAK